MLAIRSLAQSAVSLKHCIPADVAELEQTALISIASRHHRRKENDCKNWKYDLLCDFLFFVWFVKHWIVVIYMLIALHWVVIVRWSSSRSQHMQQYCCSIIMITRHLYHHTPPYPHSLLNTIRSIHPMTWPSARARTSHPPVRAPPITPTGSKSRPPRSAPGPIDSRSAFPLGEEMFRPSSNFNLQFLLDCQNIPEQHVFRMNSTVQEAENSGKVIELFEIICMEEWLGG